METDKELWTRELADALHEAFEALPDTHSYAMNKAVQDRLVVAADEASKAGVTLRDFGEFLRRSQT